MATRYLTIHGHFYQPPRENPWLGLIERQDSAFPQHDWNERIAFQCYYPNARAKILDANGSIETLFNNYIYLSFNFGPTLISWLAEHDPKTYRRIIKADYISRELNGGHGNAIAQVYNHMIMPLASEEDKHTQVIWGVEDFKYRYGRDPESIWLAETAVNRDTVRVLIDHKIKYIILAPSQAERVTPLGRDEWHDVSNTSINPRHPYRIFDVDTHGNKLFDRHLDVFFYDGPISSAVSFEHLLRSSESFGSKLDSAFDHHDHAPQLVNIATDGESYGHHEPFGEMGLAYLYYRVLKKRHIQPINYSYFLEMHPPQFEVELKPGPHGEGTAWSCAHGVGRWYRNCGCTTGGHDWWDQEWRTPLRNAFNDLRLQLDKIFTKEGAAYFKNPWDARNAYIHVLLDGSDSSRSQFINTQCTHTQLSAAEKSKMWSLLEMQRYGMFMYTSCGWFFSDIAGMEPVQNMCYAKRAIDYATQFTQQDLEDNMTSILESARSNDPYLKNGKEAYERYVAPQAYTHEQLINSVVASDISSLEASYPALDITILEKESIMIDSVALTIGKVRCHDYATQHTTYTFYCVAVIHKQKLRTRVVITTANESLATFKKQLPLDNAMDLEKHLENELSLRNIPHEERSNILHRLLTEQEDSFRKQFETFYNDNKMLIHSITENGIELPNVLKAISEYVLTNRFTDAFSSLLSDCDFDRCSNAYYILNEAKKFGLEVDRTDATRTMEDLIMLHLIRLEKDFTLSHCDEVIAILNFSKSLNFYFENGGKIINRIWRIINRIGVPLVATLKDPVDDYEKYVLALKLVELSEKVNFSCIHLKESLKKYEAQLEGNPRARFN